MPVRQTRGSLSASGFGATLGPGGGGFTPVTHLYVGPTSGVEVAPVGATQVVIELWGGGGGGGGSAISQISGGGGGAGFAQKTMAVTGGVTTFSYSAANKGTGGSYPNHVGGNGGDSTVTGAATLTAFGGQGGKTSQFAVGGPGGLGGSQSGGDPPNSGPGAKGSIINNTNGGGASGEAFGGGGEQLAIDVGNPYGGGGSGDGDSSGFDGAVGAISFSYT
jgi:hypothetical protein